MQTDYMHEQAKTNIHINHILINNVKAIAPERYLNFELCTSYGSALPLLTPILVVS